MLVTHHYAVLEWYVGSIGEEISSGAAKSWDVDFFPTNIYNLVLENFDKKVETIVLRGSQF
jgi:hypothetical protein